MFPLLIWIIIFILSIGVLVKASDYFVDSAEKIGTFFKLPKFIIGVTIVALGTSLPELISSIFAVTKNSSEIVIGNVIGSNIANIFLVLGIVAIISKKMKVSRELIKVDLPFLMGSAFLVAITILDGKFTFAEGIFCIILAIIYIIYTINSETEEENKKIEKKINFAEPKLQKKDILTIILSSIFIFLGAKFVVDSVIQISDILKIGKEVISVTAVALGTSLPELTVSIIAAKKKKAEIAIGNVLGSNIFNSFAVMGIPSLLGTLIIPKSIILFDLPIMLIASFLYFFMAQDNEVNRWDGFLLITFYIFFIFKTIFKVLI